MEYAVNDMGHGKDIAALYLTSPSLPVPTPGGNQTIRVQSVTFQMRGADQGWVSLGGEGTYHNSHTWYAASILRPIAGVATTTTAHEQPLEALVLERKPRVSSFQKVLRKHGWELVKYKDRLSWRVHNNITAREAYTYYRASWAAGTPIKVSNPRAMGDGAGFVETLKGGDRIALWARANSGGWINKISEATIDLLPGDRRS
ncbi:hypothetical protein DL765_009001 [Monosporascus sp. GIB2]|nr:hypothetical protein DL765_009001 [Monosporascus sp. GIB2]